MFISTFSSGFIFLIKICINFYSARNLHGKLPFDPGWWQKVTCIPYFRVSIVLPCTSRLQLQTVAPLTGRHKLLVDVKRKDSERQTDKESEERWGAHVIPTRRQCSTWSIAPTYRVENVIQEQYCGGVPTSTSQFPPLGGAHRTPAPRRSVPPRRILCSSVPLRWNPYEKSPGKLMPPTVSLANRGNPRDNFELQISRFLMA